MKKRLNIMIAGMKLLYEGDIYQKTKYKYTVFLNESNYHSRGISVGISYNFNNFRDLFRKNEAGNDLIKRAKTD